MEEIPVSEFRQRCLGLMDNLPTEGILITRHGHPVAKLLPIRQASCAELIGTLPMIGDPKDDLFSTGERWDAEA